ncbi:unnamed protein product, partial [Hapterophycus canaliculatus]
QILYLEGKWSCLPQLLGLIEPARLRSLIPLHKTTIRNEQAYYCCIAQLLAHAGEMVVSHSNNNQNKAAIYVCGDSHTLTPAWHEVSV